MSQVILYDLPSKPPCASWSLNPWKPRMILNFKGIDYKTEWVEYPDLVSTLSSFGLAPNSPNSPGYFTNYSSPAIRFDDGTLMMDSWKIAPELERRYPTPSLHLDESIVVQVRDHVGKLFGPLRPNVLPKIPNLLNNPSAEYFERTREKIFGMPLSQLEEEKGGEGAWEAIQQPAEEAADLLKKHGGPFFLGKTVSYADLIFVSFLHCLRRVDEGIFERFISLDPAFSAIYDASKQWLVKDD
ncbi:hypothetical protein K469DRAFT_736796 [Zopfia rhizophila CBS 207.26]|uniref:GST N-terminal domain-containing protein n=1 Tax=Zopfia rhizophila CBS 207.26 TaxID=1314779 RepID=A0A6A6EBS9_9PEZI|nr:hypothetical protein K469DRAFT_736796 [Zopfia rhizophila CBS 207.26]